MCLFIQTLKLPYADRAVLDVPCVTGRVDTPRALTEAGSMATLCAYSRSDSLPLQNDILTNSLHNTNSATVDRLLSRIGETAERDQVVAALLNFAGATQHTHQEAAGRGGQLQLHQPASGSSRSHSSPRSNVYDNTSNPHSQHTQHLSNAGTPTVVNTAEHEFLASLVSPLHIMAAAITADTAPYHRSQNSPLSSSFLSKANSRNLIDDRLSRYFGKTSLRHLSFCIFYICFI